MARVVKDPLTMAEKKTDWDKAQRTLDASYLQSSFWQDFQEAQGLKTYTLSGDGWTCLLHERKTRSGLSLFAPYGPTLASPKALSPAIKAIRELGKQTNARWIRLEPCLGLTGDSDFGRTSKQLGLRPAPKQFDPVLTRIVDIASEEAEVLASFSQSTRSYIRKNLREHMVDFTTSTDPKDMPMFIDMLQHVAQRSQALFHSREYFMKQAETLMPKGVMRLEIAQKDGQPLTAAVVHDFNGTATYSYAASNPEARTMGVSELLMWHIVTQAKARGNTRLDLFGVAPDDVPPSHPWYGYTTFKRKFGGTVVRHGDTLDMPLKPSYHLYRAAITASRLRPHRR